MGKYFLTQNELRNRSYEMKKNSEPLRYETVLVSAPPPLNFGVEEFLTLLFSFGRTDDGLVAVLKTNNKP